MLLLLNKETVTSGGMMIHWFIKLGREEHKLITIAVAVYS